MPRKLRNPKARRGPAIDVSPALFILLTWQDPDAARAQQAIDGSDVWEFYGGYTRHEAAWHAIEAAALEDWTEVYPGTRPESWWEWSAPELRRLVGGAFTPMVGAGRCHSTGVPYGEPDWNNPPMVESQPAYLDRLTLWLPGERDQVPADAFTAQ